MILDDGICTILRRNDLSRSGAMPRDALSIVGKSWFGRLSFETSPARPSEGRAERRTDARIRILQNLDIRQRDLCALGNLSDPYDALRPGAQVFRVTRAFHGVDDDTPTPITDLTLEVYEP